MAANIKTTINSDPSTETAGASRDDLQIGDTIQCFSVDSAVDTGYAWSLSHVPDGSGSSLSVSGNSCEFTVDSEGPYLIRLTVDPGTSFEDSQYLRLRSLTSFASLRLVAAGEQLGDLAIPSDLTGSGWAQDQNFNLSSLGSELSAISASGRLLYVDTNKGVDGTEALTGYGNFDNIQDAIDTAVDHITSPASATNPWTIIVQSGLYEEDLDMAPGVQLVANGSVVMHNTGVHVSHTFTGGSVKGFVFHSDSEEPSYPVVFVESSTADVLFEDCEINRVSVGVSQGPCMYIQDQSRVSLKRCVVTNSAVAFTDTYAIGIEESSEVVLSDCHIQGAEGVVLLDGGSDAEITRTIIEANHSSGAAVRSAGTLDVSHSELLSEHYGLVVSPDGDSFGGGGQTLVRFSKITNDYSYDFGMDVPDLKMVGVELDARTEIHGDLTVDGAIQLTERADQPVAESDIKLWSDDEGRLHVDGNPVMYGSDVEAVQEDVDEVSATTTDLASDVVGINEQIVELTTQLATLAAELAAHEAGTSKLTHLHREVVETLEYTCHDCDEYLGVQTVAGNEHTIYLESDASSGRRVIICDETGAGKVLIRPLSTTTTPSTINGQPELGLVGRESVHLVCSGLKDDGSVNWSIC